MRRRIEERGERCGGEGEKVIIIESQGGDLESEGREVRIVTVNAPEEEAWAGASAGEGVDADAGAGAGAGTGAGVGAGACAGAGAGTGAGQCQGAVLAATGCSAKVDPSKLAKCQT